ncbi:3-hydroxybutyryl-CoA dehydrogenase [Paenibacillus soyae]|uniref:3-hydroxybutyryl-CoA dehydrogenase n=1 Tax=Paenibacillus soyae TaxID=2969249 RepID=A0A9X2MNC3_9BACL|nr:3-hydroxybutyryl-CoA dehydrogenase [Paenibacillus soyae]
MNINRMMIAGAGQMGSGIAQTAAAAGLQVLLHDIEYARAVRGVESIRTMLRREVDKGRRTEEEAGQIIERITPTAVLGDAAGADLVIEAISEDIAVKTELFRRLDAICASSTVLASNTSSLSITRLAGVTKRPDRVIGMHFMNPVPVMPLVEVVRGLPTSDETTALIRELAVRLGKNPIEARDFPGFVSNRVLMPMINEAVFCLYEGVASRDAIDGIMTLGMRHPMGPLTLADLIGLDTCLSILEVLHVEFGDSKYRPCPLLRQYVRAGWLGRKTGRGFYSYE